MDVFDRKIMAALQHNARQSVSSIAEQVNLSRSAVSERIKRMEETGEIQGYQVVCRPTDPKVQVWFEIRHRGFHCQDIAQHALQINGIVECYGISGSLDMLIKAEATTMAEISQIRLQLDQIPHIGTVITHMVMHVWKKIS